MNLSIKNTSLIRLNLIIMKGVPIITNFKRPI